VPSRALRRSDIFMRDEPLGDSLLSLMQRDLPRNGHARRGYHAWSLALVAGVVLLAAGAGETGVARAGRSAVSSNAGPALPPQPHFQYRVTLAVSVLDVGPDSTGGVDDVASWKAAWNVTVTIESAPHDYRIALVTGGGTSFPPAAGSMQAKGSFRGFVVGPAPEEGVCSGEAGGSYPAVLSVGAFVNAPTGAGNSLNFSAGPKDLGEAWRSALEAKWEANCRTPHGVGWGRFPALPEGLPFTSRSGIAFEPPQANGVFVHGQFESAKAVPPELSDLLAGKSFSIKSGTVTGKPSDQEGQVTESVAINFTRHGSTPAKKNAPKKKKPSKKKPPKNVPCPKPKVGLDKNLRPSAETLQHVKEFELPGGKLSAKYEVPYPDPAGKCTIGWGHYLHNGGCTGNETAEIDGEQVALKDGITPQQAQSLFESDVAKNVQFIDESINVPLTQSQFNALFDFVFNAIAEKYLNSTLREDINCEVYGDVPRQFSEWKYAHTPAGELVEPKGLVSRRAWESSEWIQESLPGSSTG